MRPHHGVPDIMKTQYAKTFMPQERIEKSILLIRGLKVILDRDLAEMYDVETFNLNKAVKRNIDRFPQDFMFQLTQKEFDILIFQLGISRWGGTRKLLYALRKKQSGEKEAIMMKELKQIFIRENISE
jgi:hypothetical protein